MGKSEIKRRDVDVIVKAAQGKGWTVRQKDHHFRLIPPGVRQEDQANTIVIHDGLYGHLLKQMLRRCKDAGLI